VEEKLHAKTNIAVDDGNRFGRALALTVPGDVCAPAGGLVAGFGVKRACGGTDESVEAVGVFRIIDQKIVSRWANVRDAVDKVDGVKCRSLLGWSESRMLLQRLRRCRLRCIRCILDTFTLRGSRGRWSRIGSSGSLGKEAAARK